MQHSVQRVETPNLRVEAARFVNAHHSYIQWADRPSRKLYWGLYEDERLCGVFGLGSAFAKPRAVADFMETYSISFNQLANNIVFALHGQQDRNAGSRFLALARKDAVAWWKTRYDDDLVAFQTFVLPPRTGAVYKADNWVQLGSTTGGKTMSIRTLYGDAIAAHPEAEHRTFKSGEVKVLLRTFVDTTPKLIFMRLVDPSRRAFSLRDL